MWFSHNACVYIFHRDWRPRIRTILFATKWEKNTGDLHANFAIRPSTARAMVGAGGYTRERAQTAQLNSEPISSMRIRHIFSFKSFILWSEPVSHSNTNSHCCQSALTLNHQNFRMKKFVSSERRRSEIFIKRRSHSSEFSFQDRKQKKKQIFVVCLPKIASVSQLSHTHMHTIISVFSGDYQC